MSIQVLPARLANQIAAGEVVERPASVIKELVENSLDAGADNIHIDIEKGGAKLIRITDNGCGIVKDELMLALSRHATSKIKDLNDLEAISSLGFRGEALASISSVARLTLTSKPVSQANAWQAYAQGRDMEVTVQPAAHPNGTTIEVSDLFFNTPARRKFLRTEKTEFTHIDEIVKRIALARFDVAITLTHNGKVIRQYRKAKEKQQHAKRVAMVCGQKFITQSIAIDCQHDNLHLAGWIAKPDFYRQQNDLCYSYVNGRMMRDKLINHAIRQAYAELLPRDAYPVFVLFLSLDHKEVDVNVHPAKHEVRFHQSRYIHDFIYSVCHQALQAEITREFDYTAASIANDEEHSATLNRSGGGGIDYAAQTAVQNNVHQALNPERTGIKNDDRSYVHSLQQVNEPTSRSSYSHQRPSNQAKQAFDSLMTTCSPVETNHIAPVQSHVNSDIHLDSEKKAQVIQTAEDKYAVITMAGELRLADIHQLSKQINLVLIENRWQHGFVSQPLLLPVIISLSEQAYDVLTHFSSQLHYIGMMLKPLGKSKGQGKVQIKQFPSVLRSQDVSTCFNLIINGLEKWHNESSTLSAVGNKDQLEGDKQRTSAEEKIVKELLAFLIACGERGIWHLCACVQAIS